MVTKRLCLFSTLFFIILFTGACSAGTVSPFSTLDPHGPGAARLAQLWWMMLAFGTAIFVLVVGLLFVALLRNRRGSAATAPDAGGSDTARNWPLWGGIVLPLIMIGIVFGYSIYTLAVVEAPQGHALKIQVVARRWWWEINYPDQGIATANEIHIPAGVPVEFELESADVIHSFWVPELHGKMDLVPTRVNTITLQADQPGVYRGECAEFCGVQHAHMGFMVVAQNLDDFNNWLAAQQKPAAAPTDPVALHGQELFLSAGCTFCHTVRGLEDKNVDRSSVDLGPDLTHLSSRLTLAAAMLPQNSDNLARWISDAQHIKAGSLMPNTALDPQDLQALLAYLATLR